MLLIFLEPLNKPKTAKKASISSLKGNKLFIISVGIYGIMAYVQFATRLLFSLTCKTPLYHGGLGINSEESVSLIQGFSGFFVLILPPVLTPILDQKIGLLSSMRIMSILLIPFVVAVPFFGFVSIEIVKYGIIVILFGMSNSIISIFSLYVSICVSNAVTSNNASIANGISQAFVGVSRCVSSVSIGFMFGWSVSGALEIYGIHSRFSYYVVLLIMATNVILLTSCLDSSVEKQKKDQLEIPLIANKSQENLVGKTLS